MALSLTFLCILSGTLSKPLRELGKAHLYPMNSSANDTNDRLADDNIPQNSLFRSNNNHRYRNNKNLCGKIYAGDREQVFFSGAYD